MQTNGALTNGFHSPRTEQEAASMMTAPPVALGYRPSPATDVFWCAGDDQTPYWRMVYDIPRMLLHPYIIIPYLWYKAGIANVEFQIKASSPDVEQFAQAELNNFWGRSLAQAQLTYDYGWLGCEASYHEVKGLMRFHSLHSFRATDVWALTVGHRFRGVAVENIEGDVTDEGVYAGNRGQARLWAGGKWPGKGLWFVHNRQYDRFYGRSHLFGAWRPWRRLGTRDGAEEVCDMAVYRFGVAGPTMWYPPTQFQKTGGGTDYDAAREKAREFTESAKAGASTSFPNTRDKDGNKQWELEWPDHTIEVSGLIEYMDELRKEISCGLGVPPELLEASETGSGYSGRMIPMIGYYASQIQNARNFVHAFHWQALAPLIRMNYGRDASCEIDVKLKLPTELTGDPPQGQPGTAGGPAPGGPAGQPPGAANAIPSAPGAPPDASKQAAPNQDGAPFQGPRGGQWIRNMKTGKLRHATMGTELEVEEEIELGLFDANEPRDASGKWKADGGAGFTKPSDYIGWITPGNRHVPAGDASGDHLKILNKHIGGDLPITSYREARDEGYTRLQTMGRRLHVETSPDRLAKVKSWIKHHVDPHHFSGATIEVFNPADGRVRQHYVDFDGADAGVSLATAHAPAGGTTIGGRAFTGGEFIPGDVLATATAKEKAKLVHKPTKEIVERDDGKATAKAPAVKGEMATARREGKGKEAKIVMADGSLAPAHIKPSMVPPDWTDVKIGLDPDADVRVTARDNKGRPKTVYRDDFHMRNAAVKFARTQAGLHERHALYEQNQRNRRNPDPKIREAADCTWLMQEQATRPGSDNDTGGKVKAYGATTLRAEHVEESEEGVRLHFIGKEGVEHNHFIRDPELAKMLLERKRTAVERSGKLFGTDYDKVSAYAKMLDTGRFTPKDWRTIKANTLALEAIDSRPAPASAKEYKSAVKAVAEKVSSVLGNRPSQALLSYIDPAVFSSWKVVANA